MSANTGPNRTIWIIAEGKTEAAAQAHLKAFLNGHAGTKPLVRLQVIRQDGGLRAASVRGQAEKLLESASTIGVIALTDVYPEFKDAATAKATLRQWMPTDPRCHVHVASHDFEAWLLVGWEALLKQAGVTSRKPWSQHPESVNHRNPPAHRVGALFQSGKPPRKYKKPIDGKKLFEKLDLEQVAAACPEFKALLNCLLSLAKYKTLA